MDYVKGFVPKGGTKVNIVRFLMQLHSVHGDRQQNTFVLKRAVILLKPVGTKLARGRVYTDLVPE